MKKERLLLFAFGIITAILILLVAGTCIIMSDAQKMQNQTQALNANIVETDS